MTQALYRKWRSRTFSELVGQPHVVRTLENALRTERLAHAYLFNGPRGTGKTSTARLLAKALNCRGEAAMTPCRECEACVAIEEGRYLDLMEIDAASNNGVDDIRELRAAVNFSPTEGNCKVYIIDEVHMLSTSAFNALLKTLEEPPDHVYFVLATTEIHRIPATVISRCQRFDFRRIKARDIESHLAHIAQEEQCAIEPAALAMIAESAQGCMRDAISLLDQVVSYGRDQVSLAQVQSILGLSDMGSVNAVMDCLVERDKAEGLRCLQTVAEQGSSLTEFLQQITYQLRYVFRYKVAQDTETLGDVSPEQQTRIKDWSRTAEESGLLHALSVFMDTLNGLNQAQHPQILIELALVRAMEGPAEPVAAAARTDTAAARAPTAIPPVPARPAAARDGPSGNGAPRAQSAGTSPRVPASSVVMTADEKEQVQRLKTHWRDLRAMVQRRQGNAAADLLMGKGGMAGLRVIDQTVYFFLRDRKAVNQLRPLTDRMEDRLETYLGKRLKLRLQVEQEVEPPPDRAPVAPADDLDLWAEAEKFLAGEKQATPLSPQELEAALAQMQT